MHRICRRPTVASLCILPVNGRFQFPGVIQRANRTQCSNRKMRTQLPRKAEQFVYICRSLDLECARNDQDSSKNSVDGAGPPSSRCTLSSRWPENIAYFAALKGVKAICTRALLPVPTRKNKT